MASVLVRVAVVAERAIRAGAFGAHRGFARFAFRTAATAALARRTLFRAALREQGFARGRVAADEIGPPLADFGVELARFAAQQQEIIARAETRMLQQLDGAAAALFEAQLQAPDFAHIRREAAMDRQFLRLRVDHVVHRAVQRRHREFALGRVLLQTLLHVVPEQRGEQEARRNRLARAHARVGAGQRERDEALALRLFEDHVEQRQQAVMQAFLAQPLEAFERVAREQQLEHLVEQTRRGHVVDEVGEILNRTARVFFDVETELGRETHHAQHAHRILAITRGRVADHAQQTRAHVGHAVVVIQHGLRGRIVVHRVDREVAARGVLVLLAPDVVAQHAAARVDVVRLAVEFVAAHALGRRGRFGGRRRCIDERAESRDFDDFLAELHVHDLEAAADDARAAEQLLHLVGRGVRGHVEVLGRDAEQQVAHRAADDERAKTRLLQAFGHAHSVAGDQRRVDAVHVGREDHGRDRLARAHGGARLGERGARAGLCSGLAARAGRGFVVGCGVGGCGLRACVVVRGGAVVLAEQLADEFLDHDAWNKSRMRQPFCCAWARRVSSGLVAIGSVTFSSSGMSLCESL
ncbi:hypothetical protein PT2222_160170 [Paraburkholderia tropica]